MAGEERMKLGTVETGMAVYGPGGAQIGTVEAVYAAVADPNGDPLSDAEMAGGPVSWAQGTTWAESLGKLVDLQDGETFSREEARRLVQDGFLWVEGEGLAGKERLVGCYRVAEVRDGGVYLREVEPPAAEPAGAAQAGDQTDLGHDQHG
jgi:hypothetical protein